MTAEYTGADQKIKNAKPLGKIFEFFSLTNQNGDYLDYYWSEMWIDFSLEIWRDEKLSRFYNTPHKSKDKSYLKKTHY